MWTGPKIPFYKGGLKKGQYADKRMDPRRIEIVRRAKTIQHTFSNGSLFSAIKYILKYGN
jgi:hypothetical protein